MLLEGQQIDRYHILHLIGSGGMGFVYLAEDARIGQQVAIKVIRTETGSETNVSSETNTGKEDIHLFHREAKAIAKLDHPNILPLFDYGEETIQNMSLFYLVMPYRKEGSLLDRLRKLTPGKYFSAQEVANIVRQAAAALQHAHDHQIIHLDVKPSNFLIRQRADAPGYPDILLADFGIAKLSTATASISQSIRGTPTYMSPEQWGGMAVPASDQYALAVMTYELLTGRPPFQGGLGQMMYQHLTVQPTPTSTLNSRLSKEIDTVLMSALEKDPAKRFASITAFALALSQAVQALPDGNVPVPPAQFYPPTPTPALTPFNPPTPTPPTIVAGNYNVTLTISPAEALTGTNRIVTLSGGRQVMVPIPARIQDGQVIRLEGQDGVSPDGRSMWILFLTIAVKPTADAPGMPNVAEAALSNLTINARNTRPIVSDSDPRTVPPMPPIAPMPAITAMVPNTPRTALNEAIQGFPNPITPIPPSILAPPRRRPRMRTFAIIGLVVLLLLPLSYFALSSLHGGASNSKSTKTQNVLPPPLTNIGVVKAPTGESIGISDGSFAFDTNRPDGNLKLQAAAKLKAGDPDSANYLLQQAVAKDTNDAEALIYLEDLHVLLSGHPRLTLVIGTTLTGPAGSGPIATGRSNLLGAYIAQKEYNQQQKLPGGVEVYILIANSGSIPTYAGYIAKQIVQVAQKDRTIVGVMGWSLDAQMLIALTVLAPAHIPMVSNASTDELIGKSSYAFRVVADAATQGKYGAQLLEKTLHAKTVALFTDPQDDLSRGVASGFTQAFTGTIVATEHFTTGKPQATPALLQDALSKHPDAIYFAGRAADATPVLTHLRPADPPVVGPNPLYLLKGYGPAARVGQSHLHFTAGAFPDEWGFLGLTAQEPPFFADFKATYDPQGKHLASPYEYDRPQSSDIISYDATSVLLYASGLALTKGPFLNTDQPGSTLRQALSQVTGKNAFQGVSGAISFGSDGGVINKATVILCSDKNDHFQEETVVGQFLVGEPVRTQFPNRSVCA